MRLITTGLLEEDRKNIEDAIRAPLDKPLSLKGIPTANMPAAADYPNGLLFDLTLGQPTFSDGANWLTFSRSTHVHAASAITNTPAGNIAATNVQAAIDELGVGKPTYGSFTPLLKFGGAAVGMTFSQQNARYQKVGSRVHLDILLSMTAKGSSTGAAEISGLPFAADATITQGIGACYASGMTTVAMPMARIVQGTAVISLYDFTSSTVFGLTDADFTNSSQFGVSISYFV